ncbi:WxL protein host-binding domain-containing protein [Chryseobacterium sp. CT-SW4]|uniref:WxL protein host-binding domain-containing protein n=1 Tax=Chryseobacterium sp. SW-1 TaxID=3157343 RepID=UPI003B0197D5
MMLKRILLFVLLIFQFISLRASIVVLNGLTHTYKVENGKVYKGKIAIENTDNHPQSVKLFLQDFAYQADGSINYTALHTNTRTNGDWITLNTNLVTLKAKEKTEIFYEITVPERPAQPGSYWSVIIVEPVEDIKPSNDKAGVNITSIIRYAIQVITDYEAENAKPDLKFESVKVEKEEGKQIVKIAIANIGNLYCKPTASIEIYNRKTGEKVGNYNSLTMGLLPNTSKSFYIDISKVPPDRYNAAIIATDEEENAFALNVELEVKND